MRRVAFLPLIVVVTITALVAAFGNDGSVPGLAPTAQAQDGAAPFGHSNVEIPFFTEWIRSPHADLTSEAFIHWNADDPAVVPPNCAKCHSSDGYHDFLGLDGSAMGTVDAPAEPGTLQCSTCHNDVTLTKTEVVMPSGVVLAGLGREAVCMECHQGRSSGPTVAAAIERSGVTDPDGILEGQGFLNIHYYAAAATLYGSFADGGFEYAGQVYEGPFQHVEGYNSCQGCHDPHTLEIDVVSCSTCHTGVETVADLREIRMPGSFVDYDGDGDITTGIRTEIANLRDLLMQTMQAYSVEVVGQPIGYNYGSHPYFFVDVNADGTIDDEEAVRANAYVTFTPRLLAAAYNYQVALKDPGGYAHNAKYLIQLLHDSILDLSVGLLSEAAQDLTRPGDEGLLATAPLGEVLASANGGGTAFEFAHLQDVLAQSPGIDVSVIERLHRNDAGHFDVTSDAWRHWDEDGAVPASCSTCHSATGLPFAVLHGTQITQPISEGMVCTTCHIAEDDYGVLPVDEVVFPSGAVLSFGSQGDNLCAMCHQGRASTDSVDRRINASNVGPDETGQGLGFVNIHYFSAAATRFGGEARGGYQYAGKNYVGYWPHAEEVSNCTQCHSPHNPEVAMIDLVSCTDCHGGDATIADVREYRMFDGDFDGDGNAEEGTYYEIASMNEMLYGAIQAYAAAEIGTPIVYSSASHPYFFIDLNGNGIAEADEVSRANQYLAWTPRLMRAAYNFQYALKDPGSYVHNSQYVIQLLHDSLEDLGVDVSGMDRPAGDLF
jgi:hypothetical protein